MDLWYILFNTLVYWIIAFVFAGFFAYGKFLNLGIGATMIALGYCIHGFVVDGFSWWLVAISVWLIAFTILVNWLVVHSFRNETQRDLFGLIFTLGVSIFLENMTNYLFGPTSVSFSGMSMNVPLLIMLFVVVNVFIRYLFGKSYFGVMMKWIREQSKTIRSLWVSVNKTLYRLFAWLLLLLAGVAVMILIEGNMRSTDAIFYMIKGIGIMILVGIASKEYIMRWALLYVVLEYVMFISWWWPIAYKETLILVIILLVLLCKPTGLFSLWKRNL